MKRREFITLLGGAAAGVAARGARAADGDAGDWDSCGPARSLPCRIAWSRSGAPIGLR